MMGGNVCEHLRLDEVDIKFFCEKPEQVKCPQCTLLLSVISDGIYICLSCGKQACKKHIVVKSDACECSLVHKINTKEMWCLECNKECEPKFGDALFRRYRTECVHLQRNYFAKEIQPVKFKINPFLQKCHKCTDSPEKKNIMICLECGKKTCCIKEAKLHNILNFYHYLSIDISTKLLHCHSCQKEFNLDESDFRKYMHLKQRCRDTLSYNETSLAPIKPLPLYNTGNICYFIAIVQNLRNCTQLNKCYASVISGNHFKRNYVICEEKIEVDCEVKPITAAVLKVLNANNQRELQLCVQDLMNLIRQRNKRFAIGTQQDSHEALRQIFDELREEEINNVKSEIHSKFKTETGGVSEKENDGQLKDYLRQAVKIQTVVDKVFGGKTVNTVICRECLNVLQIIEPQLDLSLPVSDNISMSESQSEKKISTSFAEDQLELRAYLKNQSFHYQYLDNVYPVETFTVEQCLQSFTILDVLDENNKFICDKCVNTKAECLCSKQLLIHSLPPILILHLKRFHLFPKVAKNNTHIKFPLVLNVAPFCTDKCFELVSPGKADDMKGKILYALKGVIVHEGSLQSGHYYTFLRTTEKLPTDYRHDYYDECPDIEGDWYCANDSNITRVSGIKSGIPAKVAKSSGYLLFYERLSLK